MKPDRLVLEIKLRDGYGRVHAAISEEVPEDVACRGPRIADELHLGLISPAAGMTPMEAAVEVLQVRELRRKKFREIMPRLGKPPPMRKGMSTASLLKRAKSPPHTVDLDELLAWIDREWVTCASSSREPKRLEVALRGGYRVTVGDKIVYEGTDGRSAVDAYNKA